MAGRFEYTNEFLTNVQNQLSEQISKNADEFDLILYDRWLRDGPLFLRYVKTKRGDMNKTLSFLLTVLRWRKKNGISHLNELSFPKEFYEIGGIHIYGQDRQGNVILHIRLCLYEKNLPFSELLRKYGVYQMFNADELGASRGKGWVLLNDFTNTGLTCCDIELATFVFSTLANYYPYGMKYCLNHNLPWVLSAAKTLFFTILPASAKKWMKFSNDQTIQEYIDKSELPPYMGGANNQVYPPAAPDGTVSYTEMIRNKSMALTDEGEIRTEKYYKKVFRHLNEESTVSK